jgi:hypothetical protein
MCNYVLKLLGHRQLSLGLVTAALSALSPGCGDYDGRCNGECSDSPDWVGAAGSGGASTQEVTQASIDTNETLLTEAGKGAGVFIEYAKGGTWHVFAACDSLLPGASSEPCSYNLLVSLPGGGSYGNVRSENLKTSDGDSIRQRTDGIELVMMTSDEIDGMYFNAPAGAVVRFDVLVGGVQDPRYLYWVGNGGVHSGAPTDPIDLKPTVP